LIEVPLQVEIVSCLRICIEEGVYRGTSLIRNRNPLGPYSRPMLRALR